ncbi:CIC11C00000000313 [Sungouiella intermedia]|uniref:Tethering factor for nuclear proteasome STS1 n=1 Tax=Sungouiella intermedia TaxID=45354 RepID=A0A1L0BGU3_9ASCO|nr:CIC11C00000000313 [[Candida] intermedia]
MSMSAGFSRKTPFHTEEMPLSSGNSRFSPKNLRKRRIIDDDAPKQSLSNPAARKYFQRAKRLRTPKIAGLSLPVSRMIEVLDHKSLQELLQAVVNTHPEVAQTISKIAPRPTLKEAVDLMKLKADDIIAHLPYKCDTESDYSYIRIKPYLTEFLHTLSDFILNLLPPMELNLLHACQTLDVITCLMHNLPNFTNNEFQYTRATAYEQIANLWFIVLAHHNGDDAAEPTEDANALHNVESLIEFAKTLEELDLVKKLEKHNEISHGKFQKVEDYVKAALDAYEQMNRSLNGSGSIFNDLITVDYSNYSISARTSH